MKKYMDKDNKMLCIFDIVLIITFIGELLFDTKFYSSILDYISICHVILYVVIFGYSIYKIIKSIINKKPNYLLVPICSLILLVILFVII